MPQFGMIGFRGELSNCNASFKGEKMLRIYTVLLVGMSLMMAGVAGCAKAPDAELAAAKKAVEEARAAEADKYAAGEFQLAQDGLDKAMEEIKRQNTANVLSRTYVQAKEMLVNVDVQAKAAVQNVAGRKLWVKGEVEGAVGQLKASLREAKVGVAKAVGGKKKDPATEALGEKVAAIEASIAEIDTLLAGGNYISARDKAAVALAEIDSVKNTLHVAQAE
jgi:hypothetical protein